MRRKSSLSHPVFYNWPLQGDSYVVVLYVACNSVSSGWKPRTRFSRDESHLLSVRYITTKNMAHTFFSILVLMEITVYLYCLYAESKIL